MKAKTTILIVNYNSSEFINLSLYALKKLSSNDYLVYIMDNNSERQDYEKLKQFISEYDNINLWRKETDLTGSIAHGTALNELTKKVETPYFSILDADATWLKKDWDKILIKQLNEKVKCIGTQAPVGKSENFPLMFAILFETETFKKLNIDFRPEDIAKSQDTGWELREKYLKAGFQGKNIEYLNTRVYKKGNFKDLIGVGEYYLDKDYSQIFASHFGRGSSLGRAKYNKSKLKYLYKIPFIGSYLIKKKGLNEKNEWIAICKKIINEQLNK
jgi:hypothetical protein